MKSLHLVITLLLASSCLIVGCSDSLEKKPTFPIPASDKMESENFGLDLETRKTIFFKLIDAEQRASKEALALFPSLDKSNTESVFIEKLKELKILYYSNILKARKLPLKMGEIILIEGIKADWADLSNSQQIKKERIEVPVKKKGPKTAPKKRPVKLNKKRPVNVKTDK